LFIAAYNQENLAQEYNRSHWYKVFSSSEMNHVEEKEEAIFNNEEFFTNKPWENYEVEDQSQDDIELEGNLNNVIIHNDEDSDEQYEQQYQTFELVENTGSVRVVLNVELPEYQSYLLDSGATCHVTNDINELVDIEEINTPIRVADNSTCNATKCGSLIMKIKGLVGTMNLKRVHYVRQFNKRIISIKQLGKDGYGVMFKNSCCELTSSGGEVLEINSQNNGLFYVQGEPIVNEEGKSHDVSNTNNAECPELAHALYKAIDIKEAHNKFGHILEKLIRKTLRKIAVIPKGDMENCQSCALSKARKKATKKYMLVKATLPSDCLFINAAGPYAKGLNGIRYMVQTVDDHTCMGFCYFIKTQDQIGEGSRKL
jgi:hypothetical protein